MNPNYSYIDYIYITPTGVCIVPEKIWFDNSKSMRRNERYAIENESNKSKGELSFNSIRRLKKAFYLLTAISREKKATNPSTKRQFSYRLTFITLTLSSMQGLESDYSIKQKLLNHWLVIARRKFGIKSYIWKAETQKNGNIHFHITTNEFIHYQELRDSWNNVQKKLGYINLFNEQHGHINPNSTDIKTVRNIDKMGAYVAKYITKNEDNRRKIQGKIWDCSLNLKKTKSCRIELNEENDYLMRNLEHEFNERVIYDEYFRFIPFSEIELYNYLPHSWLSVYFKHLDEIAA